MIIRTPLDLDRVREVASVLGSLLPDSDERRIRFSSVCAETADRQASFDSAKAVISAGKCEVYRRLRGTKVGCHIQTRAGLGRLVSEIEACRPDNAELSSSAVQTAQRAVDACQAA